MTKITLLSFSILLLTGGCVEVEAQKTQHSRFLQKDEDLAKVQGKARSYYDVQVEEVGSDSAVLELKINITNRSELTDHQFEWSLIPSQTDRKIQGQNTTVSIEPGAKLSQTIRLDRSTLSDDDSVFIFVYHMVGKDRHGVSYSWKKQTESNGQEVLKTSNQPRIRE